MTAQTQSASRPVPKAPSKLEQWLPIAAWLPKYKWNQYFLVDLIAAISVAALLIPESMGYASVAGVPVHMGLYAAPLALIAYAMFGGSRLLVFATVGSAAALSASLVAALGGAGDQQLAINLTIALAFTTGAVFLIAGLLKLGWISNFISEAVLKGFIIGMAIQIIVGQTGKLFGVSLGDGSAVERFIALVQQFPQWDVSATALGVGSLVLILIIERFIPKLPAAIVAVIASSLVVAFVYPNVTLVESIPMGLPSLTIPTGIDFATWMKLLLAGGVMLLVAFSEGWGASKALAEHTHEPLYTNQEFRAYGIGNLGAGLLGGMAVAGSLSKSEAARAAGGKTQMMNIILAIFVLLTLLFLAPLFRWLPEAALGAIVIAAMLESANPLKLKRFWYVNKVDFTMAVVTFLTALTFDLLPAMILGMTLSVAYLVYRVSFPGREELGQDSETGEFHVMEWAYGKRHTMVDTKAEPVPGIIVYRFSAPIIFSNAEAFKETGTFLLIRAADQEKMPYAMVLDFQEITYMDYTGVAALLDFIEYARRYNVDIYLAHVHEAAKRMLHRADAMDEIGEDHIFYGIREAVRAAQREA